MRSLILRFTLGLSCFRHRVYNSIQFRSRLQVAILLIYNKKFQNLKVLVVVQSPHNCMKKRQKF